MTQNNIAKPPHLDDSIATAHWWLDMHMTGKYAVPAGGGKFVVQLEGNFPNNAITQPPAYDVPFKMMLPKRGTGTNLLVPVCLSTSHAAFASTRIETMLMGTGCDTLHLCALLTHSHSLTKGVHWFSSLGIVSLCTLCNATPSHRFWLLTANSMYICSQDCCGCGRKAAGGWYSHNCAGCGRVKGPVNSDQRLQANDPHRSTSNPRVHSRVSAHEPCSVNTLVQYAQSLYQLICAIALLF